MGGPRNWETAPVTCWSSTGLPSHWEGLGGAGPSYVPVLLGPPWETLGALLTDHKIMGTVICPAGAETQKLGSQLAIVHQGQAPAVCSYKLVLLNYLLSLFC
jgi:hypothetical protein